MQNHINFLMCRLPAVQLPLLCRLAAIARRLPTLGSGMLIGVPVPAEHEAEAQSIQDAIESALQEAEAQGIQGAGSTPFLLERIRVLTDGASLRTNIQLVLNNARVGAQLACAMASLPSSRL
jgi:pseudouridylate synthase